MSLRNAGRHYVRGAGDFHVGENMRRLLAIICVCLPSVRASSTELPQALQRFQERRDALRSGVVEWSRQDYLREPSGEFYFVGRFARNGDRIHEDRGDAEGWVTFDPLTGKPNSKMPRFHLLRKDSVWNRLGGNVTADVWKIPGEVPPDEAAELPPREHTPDIRLLNLFPSPDAAFISGWDWFAEFDPGRAPDGEPLLVWQETARGDRVDVTSTNRATGATCTWTLVPEKDWNPERIVYRDRDGNEIALECELKDFGGVWFPERASVSANGRLATTITIHEASFNKPDDPESFTPADIGVEPGFNIAGQNFREPPGEVWIWDGEGLVLKSEWFEMLRRGTHQRGPTLEARARGELNPYYTEEQVREFQRLFPSHRPAQSEPGPPAPAEPGPQSAPASHAVFSEWERYVLAFVERYQLDRPQRERAAEILARCQRQAQRYLDRHGDEIGEAERRVQAGPESSRGAGDARGAEAGAEAREELGRLLLPIDEIFEKELKPRLEQLPTSEQRARVDGSAASRPGAP